MNIPFMEHRLAYLILLSSIRGSDELGVNLGLTIGEVVLQTEELPP